MDWYIYLIEIYFDMIDYFLFFKGLNKFWRYDFKIFKCIGLSGIKNWGRLLFLWDEWWIVFVIFLMVYKEYFEIRNIIVILMMWVLVSYIYINEFG